MGMSEAIGATASISGIELAPADWLWATWRPRAVRERTARAFDVKECARLLGAIPARVGEPTWRWESLRLPEVITPQEGEFWFRARVKASHDVKPKELATWAAQQTYSGQVSLTEVKAAIRSKPLLPSMLVMGALAALFDAQTMVRLLLEDVREASAEPAMLAALLGFHEYVLPFMTEGQIAEMRSTVEPAVSGGRWDDYRPTALHLAAMARMHDPLRKVVEGWGDMLRIAGGRVLPHLFVFGLGSAAEVEHHVRRLKLPLNRPHYVRAWLAHTEMKALDLVTESIAAALDRESAVELLEVLCLVRRSEGAQAILEARGRADVLGVARQWFEQNAGVAIAGLVEVRGKLAEAAGDVLWELRQSGHGEAIERATERLAERDKAAAAAVRRAASEREARVPAAFDASNTPAWLAAAAAAGKVKALPEWVAVASLPPLVAEGHTLSGEQVRLVLGALQRSSLTSVDLLLVALRGHGRRESLEAFAWRLFEWWQAEGAPTAHKWAMHALGLLGSDGIAIKLGQLIREWPSQSLHARAATGLECLRAIGTEGALMELDLLARKLRFKGLRDKARGAMDEIAAARGITREDLEDKVIPDCGLDERGTRVFDLGGRKLSLAIDGAMKPMLKDESGELRPGLPRPSKEDDPQLVAAAKAEWTLLKKQVSQVIKSQVDRLKKAIALGRRWSLPAFEALARHPLMRHLLRGQIWGLFGPGGAGPGRVITAFRLTDEGDWADEADAPMARPGGGDVEGAAEMRVGLIHPVHLSERQRQIWREVLSDYAIIPPVPQLARTMFTLSERELGGTDIDRFAASPCPWMILFAVLPNMGWQQDAMSDGTSGGFESFSKPYPAAGITAVARHEGSLGRYGDRNVTRLFFIRGARHPTSFADFADSVRLDKIDPAIVSEAMRDINGVIAAGAKDMQRR
jgi:hypothetical protein